MKKTVLFFLALLLFTKPATAGELTRAQDTIKQAVLHILDWDQKVWDDGQNQYAKVGCGNFMYDRSGKEATEASKCPCVINEPAVERYLASVRRIGAGIISGQYISHVRSIIKKQATYFKIKKAKAEMPDGSDGYDWCFHIMPGNDGPPPFDKSGLRDDDTHWDIKQPAKNLAVVIVTFRLPAGWNGAKETYKIDLVREQGVWQLAGPIMSLHDGTFSN